MSILTFKEYLGGDDSMQLITQIPEQQTTYTYNFDTVITNYLFSASYEALVIDVIGFDRRTGDPNFANSKIIGSFPAIQVPPSYINITTATDVDVTLPQNMYSQNTLVPDARSNNVLIIYSLKWQSDATIPTISEHKWAVLQAYSVNALVGDPTLHNDYTAFTI